jgi:hypothetical protein
MCVALTRVIAARRMTAHNRSWKSRSAPERIPLGRVRPQGVQCSKRGVLLLGAREEFRAKALASAESAEQATDPVERLRLLEVAEAWMNLADRVSARDAHERTPDHRAPPRDENKS